MAKSLLIILIALMGIIGHLVAHHPSLVIEDAMPVLTPRAAEILKRYYVIQHFEVRTRLVKSMLGYLASELNSFLHEIDTCQLSNRRVITAIQAVREQQHLAPLLLLWERYQSYAFIDDETINKDMFTCMGKLISTLLTAEDDHYRSLQVAKDESFDSVTVLEVLFRFYFIKKIDGSVRRLRKVPQGNITVPTFFDTITTVFKHPLIQSCAHAMIKSRSLKSFFSLYHTLCSYDYLADQQLYREFLMFTLFILNTIHADMVFARSPGTEYHSIREFIAYELGLTEEQFTTYLLRRMYHTNRLFCTGSCNLMTAEGSVYKGGIKPLLFSWADFNRYVHLDDQLLIDPYAQELFLLSEHMPLTAPDTLMTNIPASQLLLKDFMVQDAHDLEVYASPVDVVTRFYYINRLEVIANRILAFTNHFSLIADVPTDHFSHSIVLQTYHAIRQQSSLQPLRQLKDRFAAYYYLSDILFMRDYIKLLSVVTAAITQQEMVGWDSLPNDELIERTEEWVDDFKMDESDSQLNVSWWTLQIKKIDSYLSAVFHW